MEPATQISRRSKTFNFWRPGKERRRRLQVTLPAMLGSARKILVQPVVGGMIAWANPTEATWNRAKTGGPRSWMRRRLMRMRRMLQPIMRRRCRRSLRQANIRRLVAAAVGTVSDHASPARRRKVRERRQQFSCSCCWHDGHLRVWPMQRKWEQEWSETAAGAGVGWIRRGPRWPAGLAQRRAAGAGPARLRRGVEGAWDFLRW